MKAKNYLPRWRGLWRANIFFPNAAWQLCASCMFVVFFRVSQNNVIWSVVSTHLEKNISQIGNLRQVGVNTKNNWNHHLVILPLINRKDHKITIELCISGISTIFQVRVTIWLSIIVVFSSKWSNKGHMLSAQASTFKHRVNLLWEGRRSYESVPGYWYI